MKIKYNMSFRAVCATLFSLIIVGCTKDKLDEFSSGNVIDKVVMVSLNVSLPPAVKPISAGEYAATKSFFRNQTNTGSPFTVILEEEQRKMQRIPLPGCPMVQPHYIIFGFSSFMRMVLLTGNLTN